MTVAQLGLAVNSTPVVQATPALQRMTQAAQAAQTAAQGLAASTQQAATATASVASAANATQAAVSKMAATTSAAQANIGTMSASVTAANQNVKSMGGSFSGLAAQFQDIGVTAAMGMNPLQIALQQGTQIAGQLEMAMAGGAKASTILLQGLASLVSPLSLVVIGLTAAAAAGLQMVNWTHVAKGALNLLADSLVVIAPYAVAAAAALTLLYAPAIIAGIGSLATAIWGIGTAILATIGLPALLVAGFIALVAAAVVWRDDLTRILGVDIVGAAIEAGNKFIGVFVGSYNAIKQAWSNLPTFFSALGKQAWNEFISAFEKPALTVNGMTIIPGLDLSGMKSQLTKAEQDSFKDATATFGDALNGKYIEATVGYIQKGASGAADALHKLASTLKDQLTPEQKKALKEAERQAKAYDDITLGARQHIAASQLEARTLGMTTEQINAQRYAQELLNKAANDNIKLTPKQAAELRKLGAAMAAAEEASKRLKDIYDFGKETFRGFFSDLSSGIEQGKGLWDSLGDAAINALQRIADKAMEMAADGIWDLIFKTAMGAMAGGVSGFGNLGNDIGPGASFGGVQSFLQSANGNVFNSPSLSAYSNGVYDSPRLFSFAHGIGQFAEAGPEAIMPLRRGPDGRLGVSAANGNASSGGAEVIHIVLQDDSGRMAEIANQQIKTASGAIVSLSVKASHADFVERASKGKLKPLNIGPGMKRA